MFTDLLLRQLTGDRPAVRTQRFNPRPPGVMCCQSASHAVYEVMIASPTRWFNHAQLLQLTGKGTKALSWGLIYLKRQGLIEAAKDGSRNDRYQLYRVVRNAAVPDISPERRRGV